MESLSNVVDRALQDWISAVNTFTDSRDATLVREAACQVHAIRVLPSRPLGRDLARCINIKHIVDVKDCERRSDQRAVVPRRVEQRLKRVNLLPAVVRLLLRRCDPLSRQHSS